MPAKEAASPLPPLPPTLCSSQYLYVELYGMEGELSQFIYTDVTVCVRVLHWRKNGDGPKSMDQHFYMLLLLFVCLHFLLDGAY